jgi:hypothetical protein
VLDVLFIRAVKKSLLLTHLVNFRLTPAERTFPLRCLWRVDGLKIYWLEAL